MNIYQKRRCRPCQRVVRSWENSRGFLPRVSFPPLPWPGASSLQDQRSKSSLSPSCAFGQANCPRENVIYAAGKSAGKKTSLRARKSELKIAFPARSQSFVQGKVPRWRWRGIDGRRSRKCSPQEGYCWAPRFWPGLNKPFLYGLFAWKTDCPAG